MPEFKKNHTIPKCLIREWSVSGDKFDRVPVYEFAEDKISFSSGRGPKGYSFAIERDIYVIKKDQERIAVVEKWLGGIENTFNIFLREIKAGNGSLFTSREHSDLFLLALFSLKHRSKHDLSVIRKFIQENPGYRELIGAEPDESIEVTVLENFINVTNEEARRYFNFELLICKAPMGGLILGDRPFLINVVDEYSFVPLTPYYLMSVRKINEPSHFFRVDIVTEKMVHDFNCMIAENSREWIVAQDDHQLRKYIPFCKTPRIDATPFYEPVEKLLYGYKITQPAKNRDQINE